MEEYREWEQTQAKYTYNKGLFCQTILLRKGMRENEEDKRGTVGVSGLKAEDIIMWRTEGKRRLSGVSLGSAALFLTQRRMIRLPVLGCQKTRFLVKDSWLEGETAHRWRGHKFSFERNLWGRSNAALVNYCMTQPLSLGMVTFKLHFCFSMCTFQKTFQNALMIVS